MLRPSFFPLVSILGLMIFVGPFPPAHAQMEIPPRSFEESIEQAQADETPLLVEIYAPWCPYCQRMQDEVFSDASVREYLDENFTYVRLNSDTTAGTHQYAERTLSTKELASVLGAQGVPTTVFLEPDGTPIARQPGFIKRPTFLKILRYVGSEAYRHQSFQAFTSARSE